MTIRTHDLHRLTTVDEVEAIIGRPPSVVLAKEMDHLDEGCRDILAHSPIAGIGYLTGPDSRPVSTIVGGAAGFAEMVDANRISVPLPDGDTPPRQASGISLVFLLPGVGEVLRLNGRVLRSDSVVEISVQQAFVHCAKAIHRSGLWAAPEPTKVEVGDRETRTLDDPAIAEFFAACPFLVVSTWAADSSSDTSPRGDNAGFVQILDPSTVAIPDRKGNKRADTFHNLVENDQISLAAVVPGSDVVLHLHGTGYMSDETDLLSTMEIKGKSPQAALIIKVNDVELRTNTAILKSDLWNLASRGEEMPNMMALASQHVVIMTGRSEKRSALGTGFKLLAKYPRLAKAVADLTYKSELTGEGYAAPGTPEHLSRSASGTNHANGGWLRRLGKRLRLIAGNRAQTDMGLREVRVVDVIRETASATTLVFEDPTGAAFDFQSGQFFTISARVGKRTVRRAYSASCVPGGTRCAVTIKQVNDGAMSTYLNTKVQPGARLHILGPSGTFAIPGPEAAPQNLVLIAAGSGITPIMSILLTMMTEAPDSRVALIYGNRTEDDIIFAGTLDNLCTTYSQRLVVRHVLTKPSPTWTGRTGRLDQEAIRREVASLNVTDDTHYYTCGPDGVIDGARAALIEAGVEESRIHQERFVRAADDRDLADLAPQTMTVESDGTQLATITVEPGKSLLQAGLESRVPMPYSCTVGNCGDCMVKLLDGQVSMAEPNCLTPEQRSDGYILACIGRPLSPVRLEIVDE